MAGQTTRLLQRTDYDVTGLASNSNCIVVVARKIDTSQWREAILLVRLHAVTWSGSMSFQALVAPDGFTDEDPNAMWNATLTTALTFTQGTDTAPVVKNASIAAPFGPLLQVQLKFITPVGVSGAFRPSISIDLDLKGQ